MRSVVHRFWGADYDLDVAATLLDGAAVFGECKWWSSKVGANVLDHLRTESGKTDYGADAASTHYVLFSRSGFTEELMADASNSESLHLVGPAELLGASAGT